MPPNKPELTARVSVQDYIQHTLKPAVHWYVWDLKKNWWVFSLLVLARLLAIPTLLWTMLDYATIYQVTSFYHMTLADVFRLIALHPVLTLLPIASLLLRFRTITYWMRAKQRKQKTRRWPKS